MSGQTPTQQDWTAYRDVNELLQFYVERLRLTLRGNLEGIYLTGSLSYGDFNYARSDIDIVVIVESPLSHTELDAVRHLHMEVEAKFQAWAKRLEASYTPAPMLGQVRPPLEPRPYWGGDGVFHEAAQYGNEWIINNYLLYRYGIVLYGPEFRELTAPIDMEEVQKACLRDLFQEWEPKAADPEWFQNSHFASYFVLNLCRILFTVMGGEAGSKTVAAEWVRSHYGEPWTGLIHEAEEWSYGSEFKARDQAVELLNFVIGEVSKTVLYRQLSIEIANLRRSMGQ